MICIRKIVFSWALGNDDGILTVCVCVFRVYFNPTLFCSTGHNDDTKL